MDISEIVVNSMKWGAIAGAIVGALVGWRAVSAFNVKLRTMPCPTCGQPLGDKKPGPRTATQRWWGGWTCPECQCDVDRHGNERGGMHSPPHVVECTIPVLPVADVRRAIQFYSETLGFKLDWDGETVCSVSRDNCHIMLSQNAGASGGCWVWIGLEDESLFHEYRQRGVTILQEPRNFAWGYEMKFADIDGNVLWLGTESRADLPLADHAPA